MSERLLGWMAVAMLVVGAVLLLGRYRRWRERLTYDKVMLPQEAP